MQSKDEPYRHTPVFFFSSRKQSLNLLLQGVGKGEIQECAVAPNCFSSTASDEHYLKLLVSNWGQSSEKIWQTWRQKLLQMQQLRPWTYPTGGKQRAMAETCRYSLGLLAWDLMGHTSHLPVLKKAVLQLLPKMRTCCIIPSSSYRILVLPDELHDATSPTRIWRRWLSCTLLGSRMWTEATFVPVWSETCEQPTMSMYLVVDKDHYLCRGGTMFMIVSASCTEYLRRVSRSI